ncbi:hypothetical protein ZHAS_00018426 [Anopheles sinensis]|uniref:Uncharacterized protein n=1 Tax=Anopheles sinensis TaxID=74873 RepID=A0A084WJK6_ANOSI|nr:hypothetical protein ZHAS_00018426 [Anopheles sinensis]
MASTKSRCSIDIAPKAMPNGGAARRSKMSWRGSLYRRTAPTLQSVRHLHGPV